MPTGLDVKSRIKTILEDKRINGCITGSCLIDADFDYWESLPDVDIFTYNQNYMIQAIEILTNSLGCEWGEDGSDISAKRERMKYGWLLDGRKNKWDTGLQTVKLHDSAGVVVNVSTRGGCRNVAEVINAFDMSIVMHGINIRTGVDYDLTSMMSGDPMIAVPNELKQTTEDVSMWEADRWIRQFDRCLKYWNRGFDTRPVAEYYIKLLDEQIEAPKLWTSDKATEYYDEFIAKFVEARKRINDWLQEVKDV